MSVYDTIRMLQSNKKGRKADVLIIRGDADMRLSYMFIWDIF
jgi:hypothetical protein